mgnify:CR=1 FL=1
MLAEIIIDELEVETIIGCLPHERITKQPLTISMSIQYDISHVAQTDHIDDAMNYAVLTADIKSFVENSEFQLLEGMATHIFDIIFKRSQVTQASLFIYKPQAIKGVKRVGIKLSRVNKVGNRTTNAVSSLAWD